MTRPWLAPLTPAYAAATALRNLGYNRGVLRTQRLPRPVISIGAVTSGGAGKTPLVIALYGLLSDAGFRPVVLSRGYGRTSTTIQRVRHASTAAECGDEPLLIHRETGADVWVGADRFATGQAALEALSDQDNIIFLLDDGFQHRRLHRDLNIAMVSRADLTDSLLPGGNLREPLSSLSRADILVLNDAEADAFSDFRKRFDGASCTRPAPWFYETKIDTSAVEGRRVYAFCGIARPQRFFSAIPPAQLAGSRAFPDHHPYTGEELHVLTGEAQRLHADTIVTTEKDCVRLSPDEQSRLSVALRFCTLPLRLTLAEPRLYLQQIMAILSSGINL